MTGYSTLPASILLPNIWIPTLIHLKMIYSLQLVACRFQPRKRTVSCLFFRPPFLSFSATIFANDLKSLTFKWVFLLQTNLIFKFLLAVFHKVPFSKWGVKEVQVNMTKTMSVCASLTQTVQSKMHLGIEFDRKLISISHHCTVIEQWFQTRLSYQNHSNSFIE